MSRRPLRTSEQVLSARLSAASPTPAFGLASEFPVRRREGTLRPPRVGGGGVAASPTFLGYANTTSSTTLPIATYPEALTAGDLAVWATLGLGGDATLPAGWTELESGSVGSLHWLVGYRVLTGSDDLSVSFGSAWNVGYVWGFRGASAPSLTTPVQSGSGATSVALPSTSGALGWQMLGHMVVGAPLAYYWDTDPPEIYDPLWSTGINQYGRLHNTQPGDPVLVGDVTLTEPVSWVRFGLSVT